jgi:hypothetical protein
MRPPRLSQTAPGLDYGRGLAERRLGLTAKADADLAAAKATKRTIETNFPAIGDAGALKFRPAAERLSA